MKMTIPFTKDILFKSKIAEVTSISLEHEMNVKNGEVSGNFIVSGDYKSHEVSVNKEEFLYKLPFNVELTSNIDLDTFNLEITDFYYEIIGSDVLRVNIEFEVEAKEIETKEEIIEEEKEDRELVEFQSVDDDIKEVKLDEIITLEDEIKDEKIKENVKKEDHTDSKVLEENMIMADEVTHDVEINEKSQDARLDEEQEKTILQAVDVDSEEEYITYNVHIVRELETLESICQSYEASVELVKEYNKVDNINIGDKIIIPICEDE